jgi:hypothetical protein
MPMRAAVVVGILALLCGVADAKPKKKRHGTFADYIETSAPDDPPRPPPPPQYDDERSVLVVFVVDRTVGDLNAVKKLVAAASGSLSPNDFVAVVTFDNEAQVCVRPMRAANTFRISNDILRMETSAGGNAFPGLKEAFEIAQGINATTKMVVLVTDGRVPEDGLAELIMDMSSSRIRTLVVGTPGGEREVLTRIADRTTGKLFMLEDEPGDRPLFDELRALKRDKSKTSAISRRR